MAESRLPDAVRALARNHLQTMVHLDALLVLVASPDAALPATEVAARVGAEPGAAAAALRDLAAASLVAADESAGAARYRFAPGDPALRDAAATLADMYRRFPVQVIRAVYERPPSAVQQLADAFRLRS
jgi:hypothetical protein